jgi:hypothetical protein
VAITSIGLNKFRDACVDEVDTGITGTGTTAPASGDTALETPISVTESPASVTPGAQSFQTTHTILSTVATGNSFTEWGVLAADDTLLSRALTASVPHTSNDEITKITTFNLVDQ